MSGNDKWREEARARERGLNDWYAVQSYAFERGQKQGIGLGQEQGRREKAIGIARQMLVEGFDIALIKKFTGLSTNKIQQLTNE